MSDTKGWIGLLNSPLPTLWGVGIAALLAWFIFNEVWVGGIALLFGSVAAAHTASKAISRIKEKYDERKTHKAMIKRVQTLSIHEKALLRRFVEQDTRALTLYMNDETVVSLQGWGILIRASLLGTADAVFPFMVYGLVWDYIREHPEVLGTESTTRV